MEKKDKEKRPKKPPKHLRKPNPCARKRFYVPNGEPMGRKPVPIDEDLLFKLCETMLPISSVAAIMDCHIDTLYSRYSELMHRAREGRKKSLAAVMWEKALLDKDTKMMIWLSKQHLGYKDSLPETASSVTFNVVCNEIPGITKKAEKADPIRLIPSEDKKDF